MKKFLFALLILLLVSSCAWANNYVEGDAIVVFKSPENEQVTISGLQPGGKLAASVSAAVKAVGAEVKTTYETLSESDGKIFVHVHSDSKSTQELIAEFQKRDDVLAVSPNKLNRSTYVRPNDEYYNQQWALESINAPEAWEETTGSQNIYIAVMDTGFYRHPDLIANIATEYAQSFITGEDWDVDPVGHGIHVAGIIGAVGNNNIGVTGVNWNVKIIPLRIGDAEGTMPDSAIIAALDYLTGLLRDNPAMIIAAVNMSFGGYSSLTPSQAEGSAEYAAYKAFDNLNRSIMVISAGNESVETGQPAPFTQPEYVWRRLNGQKGPTFNEGDYIYPASFTGLNNFIVVSATNASDDAPGFTNWGSAITIAAPGADIASLYTPDAEDNPNGYLYKSLDGTSMAAPHVSGAIGLLASKYPGASTQQIKAAVLDSANTFINPYAYPYQTTINEYIRKLGLIEGTLSYDQFVSEFREGLALYESLDGKSRVSSTGLLDVNAAIQVLEQTYNYRNKAGSNSGCNAGFAGVLLLAAVSFLVRRK